LRTIIWPANAAYISDDDQKGTWKNLPGAAGTLLHILLHICLLIWPANAVDISDDGQKGTWKNLPGAGGTLCHWWRFHFRPFKHNIATSKNARLK